MSRVVVEMTSEDEKLFRAFARQEAKLRQLEGKMKRVGKASETTGKKTKDAFQPSALNRWAGALTGAGGVLAGLRLVKGELQQINELQKRSAQTQITLSGARRDLLFNAPGLSVAEQRRLIQSAGRIATQTGVPERFVDTALGSALSASGGNVAASQRAVALAAHVSPHRPGDIAELSGALFGASKVTGTTDAATNFGFLRFVGGRSRVTKLREQASSIGPGLIGAQAAGTTARTGGALFAALSTGAEDFTGAKTSTALIGLAQQLETAFPGEKNTLARIRFLQSNPDAATRFLKKATFEKALQGPIRGLLTDPSSVTSKAFEETLKVFPTNNAAFKRSSEKFFRDLDIVNPLSTVETVDRGLAALSERLRSGNLKGGLAGVTKERLVEILKDSGISKVGEFLSKSELDLSGVVGDTVPLGTARDIVVRRISDIQFKPSGFLGGPPELRTLSPEESNTLEVLREVRDVLKATETRIAEQSETLKRIERQPAGPALVPATIDEGEGNR